MASPVGLAELAKRLAVVAVVLVLAGCNASSSSPAPSSAAGASGLAGTTATIGNLPDLGLRNVTTETAKARGAVIGPDGGTVSATADDGTTYSLAIPAGAIAKPTQVAVYPVSAIAGLPGGSQLSAGVQFAPDGLHLDVPATLTIGLKTAPDPATFHGLVWTADGADLHAYPAPITGATATIAVYHFSGAGLGNPPLVALNSCATRSEMDQELSDAVGAAMNGQPGARDQLTRTFKLCYANFVKDLLVSGASLSAVDLNRAYDVRDAYQMWLGTIVYFAAVQFPGFTVTPEQAASKPIAATFLRNWFDKGNAECVAHAGQPQGAMYAAFLAIDIPHASAPEWGVATQAYRLDYETLLTDLCFHVVIDPSRGFSGSKPGDAGTVTVPVGYSIQGGPVGHDLAMHVSLKETGGSAPFVEGGAPADGTYTAPYTWPTTVNPLRIDVLASTDDFPVIAVFDRITKHPGSKIALAVTDSTNQTVIKIMDEDGTNLRAITSGPLDTQPSWSPDGRKIVFARQTHSGGTTNQSIQVVNADGTGLTALTSGPSDAAPAWAPDGSRIAFVGPSAPFGAIFLMNPDGTNVVNTGVKVFGSKLSWSPDSKQIVYSNYDEDGSGTVRLYVWAVAGGGSTKLSTPACQPWGATAPDWSSTGTIGFFCDTHGNPNGNLWLATMAATGGGYKPVTGNLYGKVIGGPIWSPDGSKFAYGEGTGIVIVPEDGGPSTETLSLGGGRLAWMDWGP